MKRLAPPLPIALFLDHAFGLDLAHLLYRQTFAKQLPPYTISYLVYPLHTDQAYLSALLPLFPGVPHSTYPDFLKHIASCTPADPSSFSLPAPAPSHSHSHSPSHSDANASFFLFDLGILGWWPTILPPAVINVARLGFLNNHPSLLPFGRGKHPNFWTWVDNTPFGVSIHWITAAIDEGAIAFQQPITKSWTDTGETLHRRAQETLLHLWEQHWAQILTGEIPRIPQPWTGPLHYARELDLASRIELDRSYSARALLNLLKARSFLGKPGCWFEEDGKRYEVFVHLKETLTSDHS